MRLAEKRIFDGRAIERLEPGFVLQPLFFDGVDPQIDIMIKPEFKTNPENAKITFHRGIVAMAGDCTLLFSRMNNLKRIIEDK